MTGIKQYFAERFPDAPENAVADETGKLARMFIYKTEDLSAVSEEDLKAQHVAAGVISSFKNDNLLALPAVAGASGSSASDASSAVQLISKEISKEVSKEISKEVSKELSKVLKPIAKGVILALQPVLSQLRRTSSATRSEGMRSGTFKKNLVQLKYNINDPMYLLDCSVTMLKLPYFAVLGAHIFPVRAANYLEYICPDIASIDDTHNGVLWAEPIEEAFESSSICFSWNEVNHTLTPRVLDINLLGKDMLAAYRYLKGKEGVELEVAEEAMPYEQMEIAVRSIYEQLEKSHLSSKQKEKQRTDQQEILRPYINFLYKKTSFDAINGVAIPFPAHIQLSVRAFQLSAAMAFNKAKQRGVLPPNLNFNPGIECGGDNGVIDLYLTYQVSSDDDDDDFISDSDSSFDIVQLELQHRGPTETIQEEQHQEQEHEQEQQDPEQEQQNQQQQQGQQQEQEQQQRAAAWKSLFCCCSD